MNIIEEIKALEEDCELEGSEDFNQEVVGEWIDEGKYSFRVDVFKHLESGKLYAVCANRSGSYYSDYEYGESDVYEVKPKEKIIIEYVPV